MAKKIDLSELSEKMGVSRYLIEDWIQLGLPYERTSRGYRFNFDQVVEWHDSHVKRIIGTEGKDDKTTTK